MLSKLWNSTEFGIVACLGLAYLCFESGSPTWLPLMLLGAAALGVASSIILWLLNAKQADAEREEVERREEELHQARVEAIRKSNQSVDPQPADPEPETSYMGD